MQLIIRRSFRRLVLSAVATVTVGVATLSAVPSAEAATTFRVVGTGDSILHLVRAASYIPNGTTRSIDTEQGRDALTPGNQGRMSTTQAYAAALAKSRPGGWLIIQDNGAHATDAQWRTMLRTTVANTPNDRCILAVLPVFDAAYSAAAATNAARKANIMVQEISRESCHAFVRWNQAVTANPSFTYDGQHPSAAGVRWLASAIFNVTG